MDGFQALREQSLGEEGRNSRHPAARSILRPAKIAVSMIRVEASRSEQVGLIAGFPIVLAPKVLTRQQRRTRVCSPRARTTYGREKPAKQVCYGRFEAERILNYTFEAGMSMKTKDHKTQCPNRNRLLGLNFRHLRQTDTHFAEKCCFATTICQTSSVSHGFTRARWPSRSS